MTQITGHTMPEKIGKPKQAIIYSLPSFIDTIPNSDILLRNMFEVEGNTVHYALFLQNDQILLACGHEVYHVKNIANAESDNGINLSPTAVSTGKQCLTKPEWEEHTLRFNFTLPLIVRASGKVLKEDLNTALTELHNHAEHPSRYFQLLVKANLVTVNGIGGNTHYADEEWSLGLHRKTAGANSVAIR